MCVSTYLFGLELATWTQVNLQTQNTAFAKAAPLSIYNSAFSHVQVKSHPGINCSTASPEGHQWEVIGLNHCLFLISGLKNNLVKGKNRWFGLNLLQYSHNHHCRGESWKEQMLSAARNEDIGDRSRCLLDPSDHPGGLPHVDIVALRQCHSTLSFTPDIPEPQR